jgi:hypothetical protein
VPGDGGMRLPRPRCPAIASIGMIIAQSRRNTNVRSLALSLDEKRKLTGPCEETLRALQAALSKHGYAVGR